MSIIITEKIQNSNLPPLLPLPSKKKLKSKLGFHFRVKEEDKYEKHIGI